MSRIRDIGPLRVKKGVTVSKHMKLEAGLQLFAEEVPAGK